MVDVDVVVVVVVMVFVVDDDGGGGGGVLIVGVVIGQEVEELGFSSRRIFDAEEFCKLWRLS